MNIEDVIRDFDKKAMDCDVRSELYHKCDDFKNENLNREVAKEYRLASGWLRELVRMKSLREHHEELVLKGKRFYYGEVYNGVKWVYWVKIYTLLRRDCTVKYLDKPMSNEEFEIWCVNYIKETENELR